MIERYFVKPQTLDEIRNSWIGTYIDQYVTWLHDNGYSFRLVFRRVPVFRQFGDFAQKGGAKSLAELPEFINSFVIEWVNIHGKNCKNKRALKSVECDARNPIQQMLRLVHRGYNDKAIRHTKPLPFIKIAPEFYNYLSNERGLKSSTLNQYYLCLRQLEYYLIKIQLDNIDDLSLPVLSSFITNCRDKVNKYAVITLCCCLRIFLSYLYREKLLSHNLSLLVETPKKYRLSNIPRSIDWSEVPKLLEAVERRAPVGKRDYAILLLLITYGLRAHEVSKIILDNIDWERGRILIPERKAGHSTSYPLSPIVGDAIITYLKEGRPQTSNRILFLGVLAPYLPIRSGVISSRSSYYLRKAGIEVSRPGAHTLRHTCVQRLVNEGVPLKTIGDYIGHRSPSSTNIYTKIDIEALREIALIHGDKII